MSPAASLATTLGELADLAEIRGAVIVSADLRRAAAVIDGMTPADLAALRQRARRNRLEDERGISPTVHWRLHEIASGGAEVAVRAARAGVPLLVRSLLELGALSSSEALALVRRLGVLTLADLASALDDGRLKTSLGADLEARLRVAVPALESGQQFVTLGRALDLLEPLVGVITAVCPEVEALMPAGDVRRVEPLVRGLVLVGRAVDPASAIGTICGMPDVEDVVHRSATRAVLIVRQAEVDVRVAPHEAHGTVLFSATGSRAHLAAVHQRRGFPRLAAREEDVYSHAGLAFVPAELRQATGEIEAAAAGRLPRLVAREHIRGDLHLHTTYSDGRDTLEMMAAECEARGYEYIAITDHSESAAASRTVSIDQLARQADEIARVRERHPRIAILHGAEVDILPDGRLDFPDAVLERLDIVLASLHDPARQDARTLTRRCLAAIHHPLVAIITHPANRLVGRRGGYALDFPAVYAAAAETGTALEIDGAPGHLDLDGEHARAAVAAGVTVAISSDCHRARSLERQIRLGVGTARRGWVEPAHVLNTRPLAAVQAFIAAKRSGRR